MVPLLLLALLADTPERCSVSGTVVDSVTGLGLAKVEVVLLPQDGLIQPFATAKTDAEGRFSMVEIEPGRYRLSARRIGYLDLRRAPLKLEAGQKMKGVTHKMLPTGIITGTVRDADGEPVVGAHMVAARRAGGELRAVGNTTTDDEGNYRLAYLRPGSYYVTAEPTDRGWASVDHSEMARETVSPVLTLYPSATDPTLASRVAVRPGGKVTGIDLTMVRTRSFRVRGRVVGSGSGPVEVMLVDQTEMETREGRARTFARNGQFQMDEVPPGSYFIWSQGAGVPLVVSGDVDGVEIEVGKGATVQGKVTVEGEPEREFGGRVHLSAIGRDHYGPTLAPDGNFRAKGVAAGHYQVEVYLNRKKNLYLKSVRSGQSEMRTEGLTVAGTEVVTLEIAMASGSEVAGVVVNEKGDPVANATVALAGEAVESETADQFGRFTFEGLRPGEYRVYAWEDVEEDAWEDPEFLRQYEGQRVTVGEKESKGVRVKVSEKVQVR